MSDVPSPIRPNGPPSEQKTSFSASTLCTSIGSHIIGQRNPTPLGDLASICLLNFLGPELSGLSVPLPLPQRSCSPWSVSMSSTQGLCAPVEISPQLYPGRDASINVKDTSPPASPCFLFWQRCISATSICPQGPRILLMENTPPLRPQHLPAASLGHRIPPTHSLCSFHGAQQLPSYLQPLLGSSVISLPSPKGAFSRDLLGRLRSSFPKI